MKASLSEKPEFDVQMLKNNNKLTRFYIGLPTYDIFLGLVYYLKPIVKVMRSWKGSSTNMEEKQHDLQSLVICLLQINFLNQAHAGHRPARAWFLEIDTVCERLFACVCVSAPEAINN